MGIRALLSTAIFGLLLAYASGPRLAFAVDPSVDEAFGMFNVHPHSLKEAAAEYWRLRALYPRTKVQYDDLRYRAQESATPEEQRMRSVYDALEQIYKMIYGQSLPWPIHSLDAWVNPVHYRSDELLVLTYEPHVFERPLGESVPPGTSIHFYPDTSRATTGPAWARKLRLSVHQHDLMWTYDLLDKSSYNHDEVLYQAERTLEVYVQKGVVTPEKAAQLRESEAHLDLHRTVQWAFFDPQNQEPIYHLRLQDSSNETNPVGEGWWIFKPVQGSLRVNLEVSHPDVKLPERVKYGDGAKIIELQRLFKDPSIDHGVEAGFGMAANLVHRLHARPDGSFPSEVMIYAETTAPLAQLYKNKYHFDIVGQAQDGTWLIRIPPDRFYEKFGKSAVAPTYGAAQPPAAAASNCVRDTAEAVSREGGTGR